MQLVSPFGLSKRPFIHTDQPFIVFFVQSFIFFIMNVEKEQSFSSITHYADIPKFRYIFKFYAQVCHFDTCVGSSSDEEEQQRWNEDPFSGRLSVVDSAFSTLPPHLIDKHWNWVTILDLSRNHIELSAVHKVSCLVRSTFLSIITDIFYTEILIRKTSLRNK